MAEFLGYPVRTLAIGRFGRARVWIGECPVAAFDPEGLVSRTVVAGPKRPMLTAVGIEALIPRGPFSEYGLLGLSGTHETDVPELRLKVPWGVVGGTPWNAALAGLPESPTVGLPQEYTHSVLEELEAISRHRLAGGVLRVSAAAHGLVGSSPRFMSRLARSCVELMLRGDMADDALCALLETVFLH
jgi:hypothetical protein